MSVSVVIPALNEAGNIGRLVEETYAAIPRDRLAEVIVVDDCSEDATGAEVKALIRTYPSLALSAPRHPLRPKRRDTHGRARGQRADHRHHGRRRPERPSRHPASAGPPRAPI